MEYKKKKKIKRYFLYTLIMLHLYFLTFVEVKYISGFEKENIM